jgi:transcription factor 1
LVDPSLDDVLNRLRLSLPAPSTCDVIDINPGVGLWSKALHQILEPRRHVLVEPELKHYTDSLGPLLNSRGSRYRHATNLEEAFDPERGLLSEYATGKGASPGKLPEFNQSLLMTVNFSSRRVSQGAYLGSLGKKFFDDLFFSLFSNQAGRSLFRYGLIRILAWIPEEMGKEPFVPRTVYRRFKQTITLEAMADITEVAGVPGGFGTTRYRRWPELELEEYAAINARAKENPALQVPSSRLDEPPAPDLRSIDPTPHNLKSLPLSTDALWIPDFIQVLERLKKEEPAFYRTHAGGRIPGELRYKTPLQRQWAAYLREASTKHRTHMRAVEVVKQGRRLIADWKAALQDAHGQPLDLALEQQLRLRGDENHKKIQAMFETNRIWAQKALDDCRAADMSPPILFWSRRETHPLIVHDDEFQPSNRHMALLDVVPHPNLLKKLNTHDKMVCFRHVMSTLSNCLSYSVPEAAKMLVHDTGVEAFLKTIRGIHDPTVGGWYDLTQLRLRALPADMFVEIALAYERWPFRPRTETMLLAAPDSQATYSAEEEDIR